MVAVQLVVDVLNAEVGPVVGDHGHHLHRQGHHRVHQPKYEMATALGLVRVVEEHLGLAVLVGGVQVETHGGAERGSLEGSEAGEGEGAKGKTGKREDPVVGLLRTVASCWVALVDPVLVEPRVEPAFPEEQHGEEGEERVEPGDQDIGGRPRHLPSSFEETFAPLEHLGGDEDGRNAQEEACQEEEGAGRHAVEPEDAVVELPGSSPHQDVAGPDHQLDEQEIDEQTHLRGKI